MIYSNKSYAPVSDHTTYVKDSYEIFTLEELKGFVRDLTGMQDDILTGLVPATIQDAERYCGIHIIPCSATTTIYDVRLNSLAILEAPLIAVDEINYKDDAGSTQIITDYRIKRYHNKFEVYFPDYINTDELTIKYRCGFETVPEDLKVTLKIGISDTFDNGRSSFNLSAIEYNDLFYKRLNRYKINFI